MPEIAGVGTTGIKATTDRAAILALDADCVIFASTMFADGQHVLKEHDDDIEALLRSGKNVISVSGYIWPAVRGTDVEARLAAACEAGQVSLYGAGINPGYMLERVGPLATALCQRVDRVSVLENWDARNYPSPEVLFAGIGMGLPDGALTEDHPGLVMIGNWFNESLTYTANRLGAELEGYHRSLEYGLATRDIDLPTGTIAKGTVAAIAQTWSGLVDAKPLVSVTDRWVVDWDIPGFGEERDHYWQVEVEGTPGVRCRFDFTDTYPPNPMAPNDRLTAGTTAATAVNAIADVCAATAGIVRLSSFGTCKVIGDSP